MTDTEQLKTAIDISGLTVTFIAGKMAISRESLYNKLNGSTEFKASEIVALSRILNLTNKERDNIFFNPKSEFNSSFNQL